MGDIKQVQPVRYFMGVIAASEELLAAALAEAEKKWGAISLKSEVIPFSFTDYYEKEMGPGLLRCWAAFEKPSDPSLLADMKIESNKLEEKFMQDGKRRVNIDPGYVELSKVVLASTKNFSHRIYIGGGIYAEITLLYKGKEFTSLQWTYPDYRSLEADRFLKALRNSLK